jgi:hypothetical protein
MVVSSIVSRYRESPFTLGCSIGPSEVGSWGAVRDGMKVARFMNESPPLKRGGMVRQ